MPAWWPAASCDSSAVGWRSPPRAPGWWRRKIEVWRRPTSSWPLRCVLGCFWRCFFGAGSKRDAMFLRKLAANNTKSHFLPWAQLCEWCAYAMHLQVHVATNLWCSGSFQRRIHVPKHGQKVQGLCRWTAGGGGGCWTCQWHPSTRAPARIVIRHHCFLREKKHGTLSKNGVYPKIANWMRNVRNDNRISLGFRVPYLQTNPHTSIIFQCSLGYICPNQPRSGVCSLTKPLLQALYQHKRQSLANSSH